ncbi:transmembrane protein 268 isoform X1 [Alosa sapidissima]|uniref:transmembrane protein 268 isoform X1 n=1 Tax=Alosa sapidissima TaxID=34773 RepID=UPI001C083081|nr:transmembrane protein 268 isoform X1 [Alosa sapidissima]XP_041933238.1 transmembrane protein 268 isoform X1 [Alosa sapidissima]XP_041933239.1 transmembrane protein 268 isoform X1 [Alosa sapidissima]XP_041933240.1 transmembrane protein 268 isoform X1 [Alosa sapidissima]XP_041933241.1 transmembrane protein 268 isoform X1 [Alosa sapidissima]XP_041933242.1 transmembrane protein 268 isoform X1 [Alosa sapidissima]XP_041933243.1 transmembrane protein 268 isoform X1 [Alosa sapidissima]XP_04193324
MEDRLKLTQDHSAGAANDTESHLQAARSPAGNSTAPKWTNGQRVLAVPSSSVFSPRFDLPLCRGVLEQEGFKIPTQDFEAPLQIALGTPFVRRFLFFNSNLFNFILGPVLYVVLWCAFYSTVHLYLVEATTDFWVLCLCVSLASIIFTTAILLILHHSSKEININTDIRLIQVNERLIRHSLLIGVADWVHHCTGTLQLFCVYWDLTPCLAGLTQALEDTSFVRNELQKKLKKRMSKLTLVIEVMHYDPDAISLDRDVPEEERPLLEENEDGNASTLSNQREETKLTKNLSLVPDPILPAQAIARQLLLTYSSVYIRLLVSHRLPSAPQGLINGRRSHCTTAALCLCQYVNLKVLH